MYMCENQRFNQKYVLRSCFGAFHFCVVLFTFFLLFCIMHLVFCIICLVSFVLSTVIFAFYVLCYLLCDLSLWKCLLADCYGLPIRDWDWALAPCRNLLKSAVIVAFLYRASGVYQQEEICRTVTYFVNSLPIISNWQTVTV